MAKTAVAKKPTAPVSTTSAHALVPGSKVNRAQYADKGKSTNRDDKIVPMIKLLQSQSPQCLRQRPEYVKGAEAGDFYLRGAPEPLVKGDQGLVVQSCAFLRCWLEFDGPRDDNPNFVKRHEDDNGRPAGASEMGLELDENGFDYVNKEGHRWSFSREHYLIIGGRPYVLPFGGSAHTASREWNTLMDNYRGEASWNRKYKVTTIPKSNESGDWFGFKIEVMPGEVTDEEFLQGAAFHELVEGGARAEAPPTDVKEGEKHI